MFSQINDLLIIAETENNNKAIDLKNNQFQKAWNKPFKTLVISDSGGAAFE